VAREPQTGRDKCQADLIGGEQRVADAITRQLARRNALAADWPCIGLGGAWSDERIAHATKRSKRVAELRAAVAGMGAVLFAKWTLGLDLALPEIAGRSDEALAANAQSLRAQETAQAQHHAGLGHSRSAWPKGTGAGARSEPGLGAGGSGRGAAGIAEG